MGVEVHSPGLPSQGGRRSWMETFLPLVVASIRTLSATAAGTRRRQKRLSFSTSRSGSTVATAQGYDRSSQSNCEERRSRRSIRTMAR